ncbi:MAG: YeeE/YedE family protein [Myxococcales bacterium]|nr:MAG: YeeE/YedE family protein [Myxococcales bacterium]
MGPYNLTADWGSLVSILVPLLLGIGFGAALEMSGFGDSRKLAGQFYLRDMTVLKVMFTAIIVAGVLLGISSAVGLIDFSLIFVNPTYLLPGVVGGLIMGVGFIIGGFCPGTSLVAASTLKLDGVVFALGVALGIFAFGETVGLFSNFWHSSMMGRFTLPELFNVDMGVMLVIVVAVALLAFMAAEVSEAYFGRCEPSNELRFFPRRKLAYIFGGSLLLIALTSAYIGEPDAIERWERVAAVQGKRLEKREVYVHPKEVAELMNNNAVYTRVIDVRDEADFNLFHLKNSKRLDLSQLEEKQVVKSVQNKADNTVYFVLSNGEKLATEAWKILIGQGMQNIYIVEGGMNRWLSIFPLPSCIAVPEKHNASSESLAYRFYRAVGDSFTTAYVAPKGKTLPQDCKMHEYAAILADEKNTKSETEFEHKVKLQTKKSAPKGSCG